MKVIRWLDRYLEESLLLIFSSILPVVIVAQVFMRFVLNNSLTWSEELARYCFIWIIFIGVSYGVKHQKHIKIDILLNYVKGKGVLVLDLMGNAFFIAFSLLIVYYGFQVSSLFLELGQTSPALKIPMGLVYLAAPVGMALTFIRVIQNIVRLIRQLRGVNKKT